MSNMPPIAILLTGPTGFLGSALTCYLSHNRKYKLTVAMRNELLKPVERYESVVVGNIEDVTDWSSTVSGIDVVIHTAARVHIKSGSFAEFHKVNTQATLTLARQSAKKGVRRFIFISTIKVNGEETQPASDKVLDRYITEQNISAVNDAYSLSKLQAEQGLLKIAQDTGMEVVIIRPVLVYGPGVKANFAAMMFWVNKSVPLPFACVNNRRSLLAIDNLVSFIALCIEHKKAANEVFVLSDGEDVSTPELLIKVANAFGKKLVLLPIPVSFMRLIAKWAGKADISNRLFGSLQVDNSKAKNLLGWKPVITMDEQLKKIVQANSR